MSSRKKAATSFMAFVSAGVMLVTGVGSGEAGSDVAYTASNTIAVVDIERGEVLKEIPVEHFVTDVVFNSSGERAYVAASNGVTVVDAREHAIIGHLTDLPAKTLELSADNTTLYVLEHPVTVQEDGSSKGGPYEIKAVDLSTGKVTNSYLLGENYYDFYLSGDGTAIYALKARSSDIEVIDTRSWQRVRTITVGVSADELLWKSIGSRESGELYIPQYGEKSSLWVVNTSEGKVNEYELNEDMALRGIALVPETDRLFLLSLGQLVVVDTKTGAIVKKTALDIPFQGITRSNDGKQVYLTNPIYHEGGSVTVMDGESLAVVKVIDVPTISPFMIVTRP